MTDGSENERPGPEPDAVFIGRKAELDALRAGLERAISGRGSVLLVAGEPGIGKGELADRLAREAAAREATVLWGRAWEGEGAPPYWPWTQILRVALDLPAPPPIDSEQARFRLFVLPYADHCAMPAASATAWDRSPGSSASSPPCSPVTRMPRNTSRTPSR